MKSIHDIKPSFSKFKKSPQAELGELVVLDKVAFTKRINELAGRLNYQKEEMSRRERFLRAVRKSRG